MSKAKKILYTVAVTFMAGAIFGILFAPDKGAKTRKKIKRLKNRISCCGDGEANYDLETLQELSESLQEQLDKVNRRLEK